MTDSVSIPGHYAERENALNKTAIHRLKVMADDSEAPELPHDTQTQGHG